MTATAYTLYLTSEQHARLEAIDREAIGTEHYMGLAYFWGYEYRHHLRDATAAQRTRAHAALLEAGLEPDGESDRHLAIIERALRR